MKARLSSIQDLDARIEELEELQKKQVTEIKQVATGLFENISPGKMIRSMIGDVIISPEARQYIFDLLLSMGAGIAGKKIYTQQKPSLFNRITGTALQSFITRFVSKQLHRFREHKHQTVEDNDYVQ